VGFDALVSNTTANDNTAVGWQALYSNAGTVTSFESIHNTAVGSQALYTNIAGHDNTALGFQALYSNVPILH
jgi:trimeric autotransporter adhesin